MTNDDRIADLLLTWEEAREGGRLVTAEELCRDSPDLLDAVRERIRLLENAGWLREPAPTVAEKPRTLAERYSLETLIGSGGYAQVWRAYDLQLHRHIAVKIPKPSRTLTAAQIEDVLTEARQIARLRHVNIITVHDVVKEGAGYFIVTDLIDGETLADRLRRGPVPSAEAAKLLAEVARVIAYAHGQGVVHRDLKPANIFLDQEGRPHVGDFGLARSTQELLDGSDRRGTLAYSSPEQLDGRPLDNRSDIWSLGVVLYEILTGRPPFVDDNPVRLRQAVVAAKFTEASGVPAPLMDVCRRCLSARPEDRFAGASDLAAALEDAALRRSRRWLIPIAVAAAVAVGLTIYFSRPSERGRSPEPGPPAVAAKTDEVSPTKIDSKREPPTEVKGEPTKEKPVPRPPVRVLEGHTSAVRSVQVRTGGWIASTDEKTLRVWSPNGEAEVVELPSPPTAFAFGPSGYSILTGHGDGKVRQWWVGPKTADEQAAAWASWAMMPPHSQLFVQPLLADQPRPWLMRTWDGDGTPVEVIAVAPSGKWTAWTTGKSLKVWDVAGDRPVTPQDKSGRATLGLFFTPDPPYRPDELLVACYGSNPQRRADLELWKPLPFKDQSSLSPRGGAKDFLQLPGVVSVAADTDFGLLVVTLEKRLVAFGQGQKLFSFHILAHLGHVMPGPRRSAVHPDAKRVVCYGAEGTVCVWEPRTQRQRVISDPHPQPVTDVAVSPDGTQAVTGCRDGKVRVWAMPNEK